MNKRPYMVAMVLGTALSALGSATASTVEAPEHTLRAVVDMSRYCTTCWRNARLHPDYWGDCTQEVLARMLERIEPEAWERVLSTEGEERREFLRAIDAVKKRNQRQKRYASSGLEMVADRHELQTRGMAEAREEVREASQRLLSPRQQRILQLSFEGWSVQEIAAELRTPPERVSDEKYKAVRKLREHFA
jgi:RNA polymerase sigma factor (sigma-70 family)